MHLNVKRALRIAFGELGPIESHFSHPEEAMPDVDAEQTPKGEGFEIPTPPANSLIPAPFSAAGQAAAAAAASEAQDKADAEAAPEPEPQLEAAAEPAAEAPEPAAEAEAEAAPDKAPAPPPSRAASVSELVGVVENLNEANVHLAARILQKVAGHTVTIPNREPLQRLTDRTARLIADGNGLASILLALDAAL